MYMSNIEHKSEDSTKYDDYIIGSDSIIITPEGNEYYGNLVEFGEVDNVDNVLYVIAEEDGKESTYLSDHLIIDIRSKERKEDKDAKVNAKMD